MPVPTSKYRVASPIDVDVASARAQKQKSGTPSTLTSGGNNGNDSARGSGRDGFFIGMCQTRPNSAVRGNVYAAQKRGPGPLAGRVVRWETTRQKAFVGRMYTSTTPSQQQHPVQPGGGGGCGPAPGRPRRPCLRREGTIAQKDTRNSHRGVLAALQAANAQRPENAWAYLRVRLAERCSTV
ncbi:hypothetical protein C8R44DRAFT_892376 [Mycena epipterygia]|nr:hypothetical protein C8R44DRAFT_892376 [Mycena epipterygia]